MYYAHACPDTGRAFVCQSGKDNNLAETFAHEGKTAIENATAIARALNAFGKLSHLKFEYDVYEAGERIGEKSRTMTVTTDRHGLSLGIEGTQEGIVVDLRQNRLSVYRSNEHGDVTEDAKLTLFLQ